MNEQGFRKEPTQDDILLLLARHSTGLLASTVTKELVSQGYAFDSVGRAIRSALDAGKVELGPEMQLCAYESNHSNGN